LLQLDHVPEQGDMEHGWSLVAVEILALAIVCGNGILTDIPSCHQLSPRLAAAADIRQQFLGQQACHTFLSSRFQ
jgi:hypothetical protein